VTEEERAALLEQLRIEQTLRRELAKQEDDEKEKSKWWQSKLGLLVIGSIISSLLVPWLQYTQRNFEWKRQNQFENTKYRLDRMRECLTEFVLLEALAAEGYEQARPLLLKSSVTGTEGKVFEEQLIDLQNRRFRQNAKVVSLMIHFRDTRELNDLFQEYLVASSEYFRTLEESGRSADHRSAAKGRKHGGQDEELQKLDEVYSAIVARMKEEIGRAENESEKYRF